MISVNNLKKGNIVIYENDLWIILKPPTHIKPGKGPAYVQAEMKNIKKGTKLNKRFNSSDSIEKAFLDKQKYQYLYSEGDTLIFMNTTTFDQINIDSDIMEKEKIPFLEDGMEVDIVFFEDNPVDLELPPQVISEVTETNITVKGASVNPSSKPALLANGITVKVPPHINTGDKIVVKTEDISFLEKAK